MSVYLSNEWWNGLVWLYEQKESVTGAVWWIAFDFKQLNDSIFNLHWYKGDPTRRINRILFTIFNRDPTGGQRQKNEPNGLVYFFLLFTVVFLFFCFFVFLFFCFFVFLFFCFVSMRPVCKVDIQWFCLFAGNRVRPFCCSTWCETSGHTLWCTLRRFFPDFPCRWNTYRRLPGRFHGPFLVFYGIHRRTHEPVGRLSSWIWACWAVPWHRPSLLDELVWLLRALSAELGPECRPHNKMCAIHQSRGKWQTPWSASPCCTMRCSALLSCTFRTGDLCALPWWLLSWGLLPDRPCYRREFDLICSFTVCLGADIILYVFLIIFRFSYLLSFFLGAKSVCRTPCNL